MLVLSRKEAEKVLFPSLGITVEVTRVHGKTVRLGIDAPNEIRIIRAELEETGDLEIRPSVSSSKHPAGSGAIAAANCDIQKCLDAANLAIHLAQNQLRQRLADNAEEALDNALTCLEQLEHAVSDRSGLEPIQTPVREAKTGYRCNSKKVALVVRLIKPLHREFENRLTQLGYQTVVVDGGESLIRFLQENDQPDLVLAVSPQSELGGQATDCVVNVPTSGLRMFGVGSLQKTRRSYTFGDARVTGWYADAIDAQTMASCFG